MTKTRIEHNQQTFNPVTVHNSSARNEQNSADISDGNSEKISKNNLPRNVTTINASNSYRGTNGLSIENSSDTRLSFTHNYSGNNRTMLSANLTSVNASMLNPHDQKDQGIIFTYIGNYTSKNETGIGAGSRQHHPLNSTIVAQNKKQISSGIVVALSLTSVSLVIIALIAFACLVNKKLTARESLGDQRIRSSILTRLDSGLTSLTSSLRVNNKVYPYDDQSSVSALVPDIISPEENCRVWASRSGNWSMQQKATVPNNKYIEIVQHE